jgi:hypothetical protein
VDGTGSGSRPVAGCVISGVEPWGSASTVLLLRVTYAMTAAAVK